jgi:endo-1,4-beta-D-glucanase Y
LLLAVAANDRSAFDRIWGWTRANLMVRDDQLIAWRWEPNRRPAVADMNDAADGDILVAWALAEAADAWSDLAYRVAARRIAVEVGRKLVLFQEAHGPLLLPAISGFGAEDRSDGPVVNLSYWVFPAFARLPLVAPEFEWRQLSQTGLRLLKEARFGKAQLPTEWISLKDTQPAQPADGFPPVFGYNTIRIPLYLAWAGIDEQELYAPFAALWDKKDPRGMPLVEASSGRASEWLGEKGYGAIAALVACVSDPKAAHEDLRPIPSQAENYYPTTLGLLALVAAQLRYPACLQR